MMVAGRLSARYRSAGRGALHATDDQSQRDDYSQHSFLRLPPSFIRLISSFAGFRGLAVRGSFMLDCR